MTNSLFKFRDEEEREMFFVAIPVIALFTLLGFWLMRGDAPDVKTQSMPAAVADFDQDGVSDEQDQCTNLAGTVDNYGCPVKAAWAERDNDNDGIRNGVDSCPETRGTADNNGCTATEKNELIAKTEPVAPLDSDGDGHVDSEDACPAVAGDDGGDCPAVPVEVPTDSDSDGVIDTEDKCIDQSGPAETEGCPIPSDTDNDGVLDESDNCPAYIGTEATQGCPDRDGDGVHDLEDQCPLVAGENNGCPVDTDADGIADSADQCPSEAGTEQNNGCPADTDNDGIDDSEDACPQLAGDVDNQGCPADSDGDGVADISDNCPNIPGTEANAGCPIDTDGDGIADADDNCPTEAGDAASLGCPVQVTVDQSAFEIENVLNAAISGVKFNSNSAKLTSNSRSLLRPIATLMTSNPDSILEIRGHTDSSGNSDRNQKLSEDRARACASYISTLGISSDRLKVFGLGDTQPLADNTSVAGRELNRRVEFRLQ